MDKIEYLSHHGTQGMKWGVWNEETRRRRMGGSRRSASRAKRINKYLDKSSKEFNTNKVDKLEKKAAYLQELDSPGSTKLPTDYLKRKRLKNVAAAVVTGREAILDYISAGAALSSIPTTTALVGAEYAGIVAATAIPMSAVMAGVGIGATKLTVDSIKRIKSINKSLDER